MTVDQISGHIIEVLKNKLKLKFYAKNLRENRFDFMAVIRVKFKWSSVVN